MYIWVADVYKDTPGFEHAGSEYFTSSEAAFKFKKELEDITTSIVCVTRLYYAFHNKFDIDSLLKDYT